MQLRPVDENGDILPVLSSRSLLSGPEAAAQLVKNRLSLLSGEWWETPEDGFPVLEILESSRVTDADSSALASRITEYIRETPGVRDVEDVRFSVNGRQFSYSCSVRTAEGTAEVTYEV